MGLLSAIGGFFSGGSDKAEKVLDAGIRGLDALVFTEEEKAQMQKALGDQWIEAQKVLLQESSIRSVTRRIIAVIIMGAYTTLIFTAAIVVAFNEKYAEFLINLADGKFGWMAVAVAGFYFGPHMLQRLQKK